MEVIHGRFGVHRGHRALHAKGIFCRGTFTASARARELTRAAHLSGEPVGTTVRFSNGSGNPTIPDYVPDVRGLAATFHLADGSRTDILAQTVPRFPFRDEKGFLAALEVSKPALSSIWKLPLFVARYPTAAKSLAGSRRVMASRLGFIARPYFAFHAFKWLDANGGERWVRYSWLPTTHEAEPSREEVKARGRDYLFDDLRARLERESVRMLLEVQIAGDGDNPDDPSEEWPQDRERVTVGTLEVTGVDPDADDSIVMDPMRLTDGIEPSADPALRFRPPVYSLSHAERTTAL